MRAVLSYYTGRSGDFARSPYITFNPNCAMAQLNPIKLGKYILKSFIIHNPTDDHAKQLKKHAIVKGSGIDAADFVINTCFKAANGLANNIIQNKTPVQ